MQIIINTTHLEQACRYLEEFITNITNVSPETVHTTRLYGLSTFKVCVCCVDSSVLVLTTQFVPGMMCFVTVSHYFQNQPNWLEGCYTAHYSFVLGAGGQSRDLMTGCSAPANRAAVLSDLFESTVRSAIPDRWLVHSSGASPTNTAVRD